MTPAERAEAKALLDRLAAVVDGAPHGAALLALVSLVHSIGVTHSCCTHDAAEQCLAVASSLTAHVLKTTPPPGATLQ